MSESSSLKHKLIGVGIFLLGILIVAGLTLSKQPPSRQVQPKTVPLVEAVEIVRAALPAKLQAMGEVKAARQVSLAPQVSGRVIYVNPALIPGGALKKGDALIRIDPTDTELAYREAQAAVAQASLALEEQQGLALAAQRELQMVEGGLEPTPEGRKLASRETYVENAKAQLEAAKSRLEQARINRSRTTLSAPFDARVVDKAVETGQLVSSQTIVATLLAADSVWVEITLPPWQLDWIDIPGLNAETGSKATVRQALADEKHQVREATVLQLLPTLTGQGKQARVLLEVKAPFEAIPAGDGEDKHGSGIDLPLLVGSFVRVDLEGRRLEDVITLPRIALHENDNVHVMTKEKTLALVPVQVVFKDETHVFIRGTFPDGSKLIVSRLALPVPGMAVRPTNATEGERP